MLPAVLDSVGYGTEGPSTRSRSALSHRCHASTGGVSGRVTAYGVAPQLRLGSAMNMVPATYLYVDLRARATLAGEAKPAKTTETLCGRVRRG